MKNVGRIIKVLTALFLAVAVAVHVAGIFYPKFPEPLWSHIVHIFSYSLCLFTFLKHVKYRLVLYAAAAIYPVLFHANCFFTQLFTLHHFSAICFLVIVILPAAAVFIFQEIKNPAEL
jgi:hypothetical protein